MKLLQLLSLSQGHSCSPYSIDAPQSWLLGNLNRLLTHPAYHALLAVLCNQHICVSSKKLCVIEFMFMEPIVIGNL